MKKRITVTIAVVVVCLLVVLGIKKIPEMQVKANPLPEKETEAVKEALGTFEAGNGEILAAENDTRNLYLDTDTLNFRVEDKTSKQSFSALKLNGSVEDQSPMRITFVGEDGTFLYWNAYDYCVKYQTYTLEQIENGFRINLNMKETDSYRINEYMPQKISIERYETRFLQTLEEKLSAGEITQEERDKYLDTLDLIYAVNDTEGCYYNKLSQSPPISTVKQLIQFAKVIGYTQDELIEDNGEFGISVVIEEPASFIIPMEVTLSGEDLVVKVATNRIVNENPYYTLVKVEMLSCFGAVSAQEAEAGYIFVPDGSGALLELNHFNSSYGTYNRAIYDNTYYNDFYYLPSYPETLHMPVYGMYYGGGEKGDGGFLAIIEEGQDLSFVTATLASTDEGSGGSAFNRVYSGYDVSKYTQVSILGPYDSSGGLFLKSTGVMDTNYQVRYKLFTSKITYYDMVKAYRDYLIEQYEMTPHYEDQAKIYLEATGALTVTERILGIPYNKTISMTNYEQLADIMEDLKDYPLAVSYLGALDGGLDHKLMNQAKPVKKNGSGKELQTLLDTAKQNGQELFLQADFTNVYESGNGFSAKKHSSYNFDDSPIEIFPYSYSKGVWINGKSRNVLSPRYLTSVVDGFLKGAEDYDSLFIDDLAKGYYADYNKRNLVTPEEAQMIVNENLQKLAGEKTLALNNPEIDKIRYGKYAVNVSRESSGFGSISLEIPFRQLVMNGLIDYTTLNINESGVNEDYFLLQALELGSDLKFTVTAESLDQLKYTDHAEYLSRQYELVKDDIKALYDEYEEAFSKINCMEIANHEALADGVFETTYANGVKVIVNYNQHTSVCDEGELEPLGYLILQ